MIEHSSKATVGWINIKGRPASEAHEFQISIKQISQSDLEDEYWHKQEWWIITLMSIVVIVLIVLLWYHFVREKKAAPASAGGAAEDQ